MTTSLGLTGGVGRAIVPRWCAVNSDVLFCLLKIADDVEVIMRNKKNVIQIKVFSVLSNYKYKHGNAKKYALTIYYATK